MGWRISRTSESIITIDIDCERRKGWEQWVLLTSDRHIDSTKTDRKMQKEHLEQAKEKDAIVIDTGDLFDAMQGKHDKRGTKEDIKKEYVEGKTSYFNQIIKDAHKFFKPYIKNLAILGTGNHETAITKHNETDLLDMLVSFLNESGSKVIKGGYRQYIRFRFSDSKRAVANVFMHYSHGSGKGAEVTKGIIKTNRRAVYLPDAHIVVGGHIHESWYLELVRSRIGRSKEYTDEQIHVCIPTYKDEFTEQNSGFMHEKEQAPRPKGGWWIRFVFGDDSHGATRDQIIKYELLRAK